MHLGLRQSQIWVWGVFLYIIFQTTWRINKICSTKFNWILFSISQVRVNLIFFYQNAAYLWENPIWCPSDSLIDIFQWQTESYWLVSFRNWQQGPISRSIYEIIFSNFVKIICAAFVILMLLSGHKLHMPQQLSCSGICKIVIWASNHLHVQSAYMFACTISTYGCKIWIIWPWTLCKMGHRRLQKWE